MGSWSTRAGEGLGRQGLGAARAWGGEGLGPWGSEGLARRGLGRRGLGAARAWGGEGLGGEGWKSAATRENYQQQNNNLSCIHVASTQCQTALSVTPLMDAETRCQTAGTIGDPTDGRLGARCHTAGTIGDPTDGRLGGTIGDPTDGRRHKKWSSHTQRDTKGSLALSAA